MRESWTDQRLDQFAVDTTRRFDGVDRRLDKIEGRLDGVDGRLEEVDRRFDLMERCMKEGFGRIDTDIRELRTQTAAFQRTVLQLGCGALVTLFVGFAGVITQL